MTLTLLLDLDDTLLTTNEDFFGGTYLRALSQHLNKRIDSKALVGCLMASTQAMIDNDRPDRTLEQVFDASFYTALGIQRSDVQVDIDRFYAEIYPGLHSHTQPRPDAISLVEKAFERGYQVAVATNPLFPYTAIAQRLEWAGLSPARYPFKVVSSYETFHFAKPNPAYFAEVLAQMGWPDGPVVMVGNDLKLDIEPAAELGIQTYLIPSGEQALFGEKKAPCEVGSLTSCSGWLDQDSVTTTQPNYNHPTGLLSILKSTPAAIATFTAGLPAESWKLKPQPNEWSLTEIICHLRDVEIEVNLPRIHQVITEANPFIPGKVTDPWAEERGYIHQDGRAALEAFLNARMELVKILSGFQPEMWAKTIRHAIFGPTPARELVGFMTTHDRTHIQQIVQTLEPAKHNA